MIPPLTLRVPHPDYYRLHCIMGHWIVSTPKSRVILETDSDDDLEAWEAMLCGGMGPYEAAALLERDELGECPREPREWVGRNGRKRKPNGRG